MVNIFNYVQPCPCGYFGDSQKPCTCASAVVTKYQKRISGPLLDRIDIHIEVPRVDYEKLSGNAAQALNASMEFTEFDLLKTWIKNWRPIQSDSEYSPMVEGVFFYSPI